MNAPQEIRRIVFTGENAVATQAVAEALTPGPQQVLIRTRYSCISAGTELAKLTGLQRIAYPWVPGNRTIGRVVETGVGVRDLKPGDLVFSHSVHASLALGHGLVMRIPDALDRAAGATLGMALVALVGVQTAEAVLGDRAVVVGGGLVGQYAAQLLELGGVETILVDVSQGRLDLARRCGISHTVLAQPDGGETARILELTQGRGAETVIDCTGITAVIERATAYAARSGTLVLAGSPRGDHRGDLTAFLNCFHLWRPQGDLTLKGAHEWKLPVRQSEFARHSMERNLDILARLMLAGRLRADELTTSVYRPEHADAAYRELQERRDGVVGAVFDWTHDGDAA